MFDTPDFSAWCLAPFVAACVGLLIYFIGSIVATAIEAKTGKRRTRLNAIVRSLIIIGVPVTCFASVALEIGVRDPAPWFRPSSNDIVGEWRLSVDPTDKFLESTQLPLPARKTMFFEDGTFRVEGIPDLWSYTNLSALDHVSYISGSGTWYLGQTQGTERLEWVLFTQFQKVDDHDDTRLMRYYFERHLPPYILVTLDSGYRGFAFERN